MRHFGDDAGDEGHAEAQQLVGHAIVADGADGRIAADDFAERVGGGVTVVGGFDVGGQDAPHLGQGGDEACRLLGCLLAELLGTAAVLLSVVREAETSQYLFGQLLEELFDVNTDVVFQCTAVYIRDAEVAGEDDSARQFDNLLQRFSRGKGGTVRMLVEKAFVGLGFRKLVYRLCQDVSKVEWTHPNILYGF